MFGIKRKQRKLAYYKTSPRRVGMVYVFTGVPLLALHVLNAELTGAWDRWGTWLTVAILGAIVIRYAYLWLFRRKPFENNVVLGTLSHGLYLRYGKLWLVGALAAAVVGYPALLTFLGLLDCGFKALDFNEWAYDMVAYSWLLMMFVFDVLTTYIDLQGYYRSQENTREYIDWY